MSNTITLSARVDHAEIAFATGYREKLNLIDALDNDEASVEFTVSAIKLLLRNLKAEYTINGLIDPEFKEIFKDIKKSVK